MPRSNAHSLRARRAASHDITEGTGGEGMYENAAGWLDTCHAAADISIALPATLSANNDSWDYAQPQHSFARDLRPHLRPTKRWPLSLPHCLSLVAHKTDARFSTLQQQGSVNAAGTLWRSYGGTLLWRLFQFYLYLACADHYIAV